MEHSRTYRPSRQTVSRRRRTPGWIKNVRTFLLVCGVSAVIGAASLIHPLLGLTAAAGLAVVFAAIRRPVLLAYLVTLAVALTSGMQRGGLIPMFKPNELVLFGSVMLALPVIILQRLKMVRVAWMLLAAQAILIVGTVFLPLVTFPMRGINLSFADQFNYAAPLQYVLLFLLFVYLPLTDDERRNVFFLMVVGAIVVAVIGLLEAAKVGPVMNLLAKFYPSKQQAVASQFGRITSLLNAWNNLGTFFTVSLLLLIGYLQVNWTTTRHRAFLLTGVVMSGFGLLASGSFAGIVGLAVGLVVISLINRTGLRTMIIVGLVLLLAGALLSGFLAKRLEAQFGSGSLVPSTLAYRVHLWTTIFIPLMEKYWLFGYQPNFVTLSWQWAESQYLFLMLRAGIFALLAHLAWIGLTLAWLMRRFRAESGFTRAFAVSLFAILIALSIMGFTNEVFTYSGVIDYIWMGLGMLAGYRVAQAPAPAAAEIH